MTTSILGLRTTIYKVPKEALQDAKAWYTKAFGVEPYFDEPFYVGFEIGGYELGVQPMESTAGDNIATYWGVSDIKAEYQKFLDNGAVQVEEPTNVGGEIMTGTVKDPWGNLIGLIYNPEFKAKN